MNDDTERTAAAAAVISLAGLAQSGPAGLGFLLDPTCTPFWFVLSAVALPTGELLAAGRSYIYRRTGATPPGEPPKAAPEADENGDAEAEE